MENEVLLQVKGLSFTYGEEPVLKDVNLIIRRGERIAVMGSNGAGKSTFFLNLNGVLRPDSGEILLCGSKIGKKELNLLRKKVGFVFQDADSQIIAANVRAEISFGPMNLGLERSEVIRRVDAAVSYLGLEELQQRAPHYLSGGEKKQVSISGVVVMKPEILLFDEPTASLDWKNTQLFKEQLKKLEQEQITQVISTHDMEFVWEWADRVLVFSEGELLADDRPEHIFGDEELLKRASLRQPVLYQLPGHPKTIEEWKQLQEKEG